MQYASVTDFVNLFQIDLNGTENYPVSVEDKQLATNQINHALRAATEELNLYIGARYDLPLTNWSDFVRDSCCRIARKNTDLYNDREKVRTDYEDVIAAFKKVAKGEIALFDFEGNQLPEQTTIQTIPTSRLTVINRAASVVKISF